MPPRVKTKVLSSLQAVNKGTLLFWGCCLSSFSYDGEPCLQTLNGSQGTFLCILIRLISSSLGLIFYSRFYHKEASLILSSVSNTSDLSRPWLALLSFPFFVPSPMVSCQSICNIATCGLFTAFCLFLDCRSLTFLTCFVEYLGQYLVDDMLKHIC